MPKVRHPTTTTLLPFFRKVKTKAHAPPLLPPLSSKKNNQELVFRSPGFILSTFTRIKMRNQATQKDSGKHPSTLIFWQLKCLPLLRTTSIVPCRFTDEQIHLRHLRYACAGIRKKAEPYIPGFHILAPNLLGRFTRLFRTCISLTIFYSYCFDPLLTKYSERVKCGDDRHVPR